MVKNVVMKNLLAFADKTLPILAGTRGNEYLIDFINIFFEKLSTKFFLIKIRTILIDIKPPINLAIKIPSIPFFRFKTKNRIRKSVIITLKRSRIVNFIFWRSYLNISNESTITLLNGIWDTDIISRLEYLSVSNNNIERLGAKSNTKKTINKERAITTTYTIVINPLFTKPL
tara:strand:+ start:383 stop:901 length:519 start_codon:yes stop_codon:yes gene_type:complete